MRPVPSKDLIVRERLLVSASTSLALVPWLEAVFDFWRQDGDDVLGAQGARIVENILCQSIEVRPVLRSTIEDAEQQRIRLTNTQAKILRTIGGRKRAVISGGAGTGKTLIAVEKARQLARGGLSVLLLCYNRPLADALSAGLQHEARVQVLSFHQLCDRRIAMARANSGRDLFTEAVAAYPGNSNTHCFDVQDPAAGYCLQSWPLNSSITFKQRY